MPAWTAWSEFFFFSTSRDPDIYVDVTGLYETKLAASMVHRSQFPRGEESLEWMKDRDRQSGQVIDTTYAERFKRIAVW